MDIKDLLREDDAVSPVIGVILMVAITVILAAVIGTFVLGLGDQVQSSAPNANFQFEYANQEYSDDGGTTTYSIQTITITHNGGQDVEADNVNILVDGNEAYDLANGGSGASPAEAFTSGATLSTGDSGDIAFYNTGDGAFTTGSGDIGISSGPSLSYTGSTSPAPVPSLLTGGEDVRVVWESPSGDSSNTIGSSTVPN